MFGGWRNVAGLGRARLWAALAWCMRRRWRWLSLLTMCALLLVLWLGRLLTPLVLHDRVVRKIATATGLEVQLSSLDLSLTGRVSLRGLLLRDTSGALRVHIPSLVLSGHPWALWREGAAAIEVVEVEGAQVAV
ncbi:MAG: hypothetical protein ACPGUV_12600, partial [Polyangiales bacterium]